MPTRTHWRDCRLFEDGILPTWEFKAEAVHGLGKMFRSLQFAIHECLVNHHGRRDISEFTSLQSLHLLSHWFEDPPHPHFGSALVRSVPGFVRLPVCVWVGAYFLTADKNGWLSFGGGTRPVRIAPKGIERLYKRWVASRS